MIDTNMEHTKQSSYRRPLSPDAFILQAVKALDIPAEDEDLFKRFVEKEADKLDALWADFLEREAVDCLYARAPSLRTQIRHTTLSNYTKGVLERAYILTVKDLVEYSPEELKRFRGLGPKSLEEITEFVKSLGLS